MAISCLALLALLSPQIPKDVEIKGSCESRLIQSFYDLEDGSLSERYTFELNQSVEPRPQGYDWSLNRVLTAHRLDDLDLDVPKAQKPTTLKSVWNARGMDVAGKPFFEDWTEYRIERLRWFVWPSASVQPGQSWQAEPPIALDHDVPRVRLTFTLERVAGSRAWVQAKAEELGTSNGIRSAGKLVVSLATGWVERGEWTSPSAPMPGGVQTRYRLVQRLVPKGEAGIED